MRSPKLFRPLFAGMTVKDPVVRARAADATEKISRSRPDLIQPFKQELISEISEIPQQEVRWHVAQMFSYLNLTESERSRVIQLLTSWLDTERSGIVRVSCIQTLSDLSKKDPSMRPGLIRRLNNLLETGTPALRARAKRLISELSDQ